MFDYALNKTYRPLHSMVVLCFGERLQYWEQLLFSCSRVRITRKALLFLALGGANPNLIPLLSDKINILTLDHNDHFCTINFFENWQKNDNIYFYITWSGVVSFIQIKFDT